MYILTNAFNNLGRNKGRNILLGIIIFILILSTTVGLVINTTTKGIIEDYKARFGSEVTLSVDFDKLMAEYTPNADGRTFLSTAPKISPEKYVAFADSECLKTYHMNMLAGIVFENLKAVDEQANEGMGSIGGGNGDYISPTAKLLGYTDPNDMPDFANGLRKMIEGTLYQGKNECIVSSDFADLNQLGVGDTFVVKDTKSKKTIALKVAGIYADATEAKKELPASFFSMEGSYGNRRNEIFVNIDTVSGNFDISGLTVNAEYELKSPDLVQDFEKELRDKGLPDAYNVETDEASYNKIVAPVIGLSKISMTFVWVILVVGSMILLLITTMAIRERKYEIGVLRAMGLKKEKISVMFVAETVMITVLCLGLGLGIGNAVSQPVADSLIASQVEAIAGSAKGDMQFSGSISTEESNTSASASNVQPLSEIDVSLTSEASLQIALIALALALLSSATGVIFITKYEPMKILSERN